MTDAEYARNVSRRGGDRGRVKQAPDGALEISAAR
jgi:hypothetical protein